MKEKIIDSLETIRKELVQCSASVKDKVQLEHFRVAYLGRKGKITSLLRLIGKLPPRERPRLGALANELKELAASEVKRLERKILQRELQEVAKRGRVDITLAGRRSWLGHSHPITRVMREALDIFLSMGFSIHEGPEVETEYYNFDALNTPKEHPARDMHDTFYIDDGLFLLRTHTSPVQIHVMEENRPPIFSVFPGVVYRRDYDISHTPMFHQIEGLMVDKDITFGNLKGVLTTFCHKMFGEETRVRFRPSFFPFTEPSAEVDIECTMCRGKGCRYCSQSGWVELLGAGMVHPNVFETVGYDPDEYTGFAFGVGVDRIATIKYRIGDSRLLYESSMDFLEQF